MRCKDRSSRMFRRQVLLALVALPSLWLAGCNSWFDQSELARERSDRLVKPILTSIDPIDEAEEEFASAQDVRPFDLKVIVSDYVIGPNDLLSASVYDLIGPGGVETTKMARVSETGNISLPMLPEPIKASGLTEFELQQAIVKRYQQAGILTNARVSVSVVEARQRTFSILGAVARPGQYAIVETDFRILNALVQAGGTTNPAEYLFVVRKIRSETPTTRPAVETAPPPVKTTQPTGPDILEPRLQGEAVERPILAAETPERTAPTTAPAGRAPLSGTGERLFNLDGQVRTVAPSTQPVVPPAITGARPTVDTGFAAPTTQPAFEFGAGQVVEDTRVIRVPLQLLKNGDLRYNIVVRPGDLIIVPEPTVGFYYMSGHFGAPGAYNMTGQKITLKQAVAAARMLDPLAVPERTDVVRRVGGNEVFVRVNLRKIHEGTQPDVFLKPNDLVIVGTDFYPPFLQAVRGAFRLTYGFGFLYDRNYAPFQPGQFGNAGG